MISKNLSIIIPAYKPDYLFETLSSFASQSDNRFTIYIGDDASPHDLSTIVKQFETKISIEYHRFDRNLGGTNLVGHWSRCIDLSQNEDWIWLFSDDDIANPDCVALFYKAVNTEPKCSFFKYRVDKIGAEGENLKFNHRHYQFYSKKTIDIKDFIRARLESNGVQSFAIEYIFSRSLYDKIGLEEMPLAWGADDLTWFNYGAQNGNIMIIPTTVYWRYSGKNISASFDTHTIDVKFEATIKYLQKVNDLAQKLNVDNNHSLLANWFTVQLVVIRKSVSRSQFCAIISKNLQLSAITAHLFYLKYVLMMLRSR